MADMTETTRALLAAQAPLPTSAARPMQGLAEWLRDEAARYDPFNEAVKLRAKRLNRWASEVEAVQAQPASAPMGEPLTETYVQPVPDHCDRITWRNRYYSLPLAAPAQARMLTREEVYEYADRTMICWPRDVVAYAEATQRKFCEVNGIQLQGESSRATNGVPAVTPSSQQGGDSDGR